MAPCADAFQHRDEAVEIHGLVQAIANGLADQRMIGNARSPREIFGAGGLVGEDRGQQVVGAHALDGRAAPSRRAESAGWPARAKHSSASAR